MNKDKIFKITELLILLTMLVLIGKIAYAVKIDNEECFKSPLTYGARRYDEANEKDHFSCTCGFGVPNSPLVFFDKDGIDFDKLNLKNSNVELDLDWEPFFEQVNKEN